MADAADNMEVDAEGEFPTTMESIMDFMAQKALYRGIEAVDRGDYTGALYDFHMCDADKVDGGAMEAEFSATEKKDVELVARWIRSLIMLNTPEFQTKADSDLTRVIELKPNFLSGFKNRACARDALGRHQEALADIEKALALANEQGVKDADIYYNKGVVLDNMGKFADAIEQYNLALSMDPNSPKHYNNRGYAQQQLGEYAKAIADYTKCLSLEEEFAPTPFVNRTRCYEQLKKWTEAIEGWTTLVIKVGDPWALVQRAKARIASGDKDGARTDLFSALESADCDVKKAHKDEWEFAVECRDMLRKLGL